MSAPKIRELSPELQERACKELHEVPSRRAADIAYIREWLKKQPHIKANPDDQTLIAFLRGCKFSLERTKEKLDLYYTMRTAVPEFFRDRNIKDPLVKEILKLGGFFPLPDSDKEGRRVFVMRAGMGDPGKIKMEEFFRVNFMMMDYLLHEDDQAVVTGTVNVMDMGRLTMGHAAQMNPSLVKRASVCSQDAYPLRPKGMNFINTPSLFFAIYNLFKSFTKEKMKRRLFVHGDDMESLFKNVPKNILPVEYGGEAGSVEELNDAWMARLEEFHDWFLADADSGVDESKRPGKPKTQQDLFGLEGSFRQLNVD